jgi:hypothetical protein
VKKTNPGKDFLRFITHLENVHQRRREEWRQFRGGDIVRKRGESFRTSLFYCEQVDKRGIFKISKLKT